MTFPDYKNKKVLIFGLGLLGRGVKDAIFFAEKGAEVRVTDLKKADALKESLEKLAKYQNISYTLGEHKEEDILWADLIIKNAGIPQSSPFLQFAIKNKKNIEMDESLFAKYCPCPIIGITGTRGKSTTTMLIGTLLQKTLPDKKIYLAGNLQGEATLPLIDIVTKDDLVVLELSSWQLQGFGVSGISPHIAVFTNIYHDHLNSYKNMTDYINDKKNIFKFQKSTDFFILNKDYARTRKLQSNAKANIIFFSGKDVPKKWKLKLLGKHNHENIAAAIAVGKIFNIPIETMESILSNFSGLEHRLEFVREVNGVTFINDTTSTTPIAGEMALKSIKKPVILIAGGATKNIDLNPFAKVIAKKTKAVVLLAGTATPELKQKIIAAGGENLIAGEFDNFKEAIRYAYSISLPSDVVLLSPGCASFGLFVNEFDRGNQFKKIVNQL